MLILKHPNGDAVQIEAVQKVLDALFVDDVHPNALLQLNDGFGHRLDNGVVTLQDAAKLTVEVTDIPRGGF